jgi:hypothetical protein
MVKRENIDSGITCSKARFFFGGRGAYAVSACFGICVVVTVIAVKFSFETKSDRHWCLADVFLTVGTWCR